LIALSNALELESISEVAAIVVNFETKIDQPLLFGTTSNIDKRCRRFSKLFADEFAYFD
jgi:hypothetical protein